MANQIPIYKVDKPWLETNCSLGEGPYYDAETGIFRFVDIENNELHTVDIGKGVSSHKVVAKLDHPIACTANIAGRPNEILFSGGHGFGVLDLRTGQSRVFHEYWTEDEKQQRRFKEQRGNDGNVSPDGRFFAGTMVDPRIRPGFPPEGVLFRLDQDLSVHRIKEGVSIPNGTSWTSDGKTMYWTDSPSKAVYKYDYDRDTGLLSNEKTFYKHEGEGVPDGHAHDVHGHLWVAIALGSKVVRVSPNGHVVAEIHLPTRLVTCPTFVEEDLIITTAAEPDPETYAASSKYQGRLYRVHVGVKGQPPNLFGGNP